MALALAGAQAWAALPELTLAGNRLESGRHILTLGPSGLPEQIFIKAVPSELPLEQRGGNPSQELLLGLGRGNTLAAPIAVLAIQDGQPLPAEILEAAKPKLVAGQVVVKAKLRAGGLPVTLELTYGRDGSLAGQLTYGGGRCEGLELVVPLLGRVDTIIAGPPVDEQARAYDPARFAIGGGGADSLIWGNGPAEAAAIGTQPRPGVVAHLYVGSGDRGFTWLSETAGWRLDAAASSMLIEQAQDGSRRWRIRLVNQPGEIGKPETVRFALLTHPATSKPADHRRLGWLDWAAPTAPPLAAAPTLELWRQTDVLPLVRADLGTVLEARAGRVVLAGPAGGAALSAQIHHAETYPLKLLQYLAGTHTGNLVRLESNAAALIRPGANPAPDRMLLGRALLLDIGLDAGSLAHLGAGLRLATALEAFGYFEADAQTEYIPPWRTGGLLRFGQPWLPDSNFAEATEDPLARVQIAVFRRSTPQGVKAMLLIVNESAKPVRDAVYVLSPGRLFGGPNRQQASDVVAGYDYRNLPARSDWGQPGATSVSRGFGVVLTNLEDGGLLPRFADRDGVESYGPALFIPAHDFRLLGGFGTR